MNRRKYVTSSPDNPHICRQDPDTSELFCLQRAFVCCRSLALLHTMFTEAGGMKSNRPIASSSWREVTLYEPDLLGIGSGRDISALFHRSHHSGHSSTSPPAWS